MRKLVIYLSIFLSFSNSAQTIHKFEAPIYKSKEIFKLSDYLGKKKIVINFWASWCTACIQELPILRELKSQNKTDTVFVAINAGERTKLIKKFLKRYDFPYLILEDRNKKIADLYKIERLPQTIVINKKGKIVYRGEEPPRKI